MNSNEFQKIYKSLKAKHLIDKEIQNYKQNLKTRIMDKF